MGVVRAVNSAIAANALRHKPLAWSWEAAARQYRRARYVELRERAVHEWQRPGCYRAYSSRPKGLYLENVIKNSLSIPRLKRRTKRTKTRCA